MSLRCHGELKKVEGSQEIQSPPQAQFPHPSLHKSTRECVLNRINS